MKLRKWVLTLGICTIMVSNLLTTGGLSVSAAQLSKDTINSKISSNFTPETQTQIQLIADLVKQKSISTKSGIYEITNESDIEKSLPEDKIITLKKYLDVFNEGISLGLFEIDNKNILQESTNYEKTSTIPEVIAQSQVVDLDGIFYDNGATMLRTVYINIQTYGNLAGYYTGKFFASKVRSGGEWDYKLYFGYSTRYLASVNGSLVSMTGEDIGNSNYGFAGRKAFGADLLKAAAGAYQIYSGTSYLGWYKSYFDDPNDQYWINRGIRYSEGGSF